MAIAKPRRSRRPTKPDRRCALALLAVCPDGVSGAVMLAHGYTIEQIVELVCAGLATATPQRVRAGGKAIEVPVLRITDAERKALDAK